jgi:MFS family permease
MASFKEYFGIAHPQANSTNIDDYIETSNGKLIIAGITSSFLFTCVIGAGVFSIISDILGRKVSIIVGGILFTIGGILQAWATSFATLIVGRVFSGLAIGTISLVCLYSQKFPSNISYQLIGCSNVHRRDSTGKYSWLTMFYVRIDGHCWHSVVQHY